MYAFNLRKLARLHSLFIFVLLYLLILSCNFDEEFGKKAETSENENKNPGVAQKTSSDPDAPGTMEGSSESGDTGDVGATATPEIAKPSTIGFVKLGFDISFDTKAIEIYEPLKWNNFNGYIVVFNSAIILTKDKDKVCNNLGNDYKLQVEFYFDDGNKITKAEELDAKDVDLPSCSAIIHFDENNYKEKFTNSIDLIITFTLTYKEQKVAKSHSIFDIPTSFSKWTSNKTSLIVNTDRNLEPIQRSTLSQRSVFVQQERINIEGIQPNVDNDWATPEDISPLKYISSDLGLYLSLTNYSDVNIAKLKLLGVNDFDGYIVSLDDALHLLEEWQLKDVSGDSNYKFKVEFNFENENFEETKKTEIDAKYFDLLDGSVTIYFDEGKWIDTVQDSQFLIITFTLLYQDEMVTKSKMFIYTPQAFNLWIDPSSSSEKTTDSMSAF